MALRKLRVAIPIGRVYREASGDFFVSSTRQPISANIEAAGNHDGHLHQRIDEIS